MSSDSGCSCFVHGFVGCGDELRERARVDRVTEPFERADAVVPVFFLNLGCARLDGAANNHATGNRMSEQTNSPLNAPGFSVGAEHPIELANACSRILLLLRELPGGLLVSDPPERLVGVGHTIRPSSPFTGTFGW